MNKHLKALQRQLKQQAKERPNPPLPIRRRDGLRNYKCCLDPGAFALKQCESCGYGERCDFQGKGDYKKFKLTGVGK